MSCVRNFVYSLFVVVAISTMGFGQPATGLPQLASFGGGPFDTVTLGNMNIHFAIPVFTKQGRGMPFSYALTYDSSVWYPVGVSGSQTWVPVSNWGWQGQGAAALGSVSYTTSVLDCYTYQHGVKIQTGEKDTYSNWRYYDRLGTRHAFAVTTYSTWGTQAPCTGQSPPVTALASDGSGYTLHVTNATGAMITTPDGILINCGSGGACSSETDRNGNQISFSSGTFTDTLNTAALTVTGAAPNPVTMSYVPPGGGSAATTITYKSYTVATNFGASGITESAPRSVSLIDSITLPDSTAYSFTYEPTPSTPTSGACSPLAGTYSSYCVTGRIASVQLPTGGSISYAYSNGSNGINGDGSTATLTRTLVDGFTSNQWVYAHSLPNGISNTAITDPAGNVTYMSFAGIYEISRTVTQKINGNLTTISSVYTCYNATSPAWNTCSATVTPPFTRRTVFTQFPDHTGKEAEVDENYDSYGLMTEQDSYDFGTSGSGSPGAALRKELLGYSLLSQTISGVTQSFEVLSWDTITDGAGTQYARSTYGYDNASSIIATSGIPQHTSVSGSRGLLTSAVSSVTSMATLTKTYAYYDTGVRQAVTDVNGAITTYSYGSSYGATDSCSGAFPSSVNSPLGLTRSYSWNCTGGRLTQATDENGQRVTANYTDPDLWRPANVYDQQNNETIITYNAAKSVEKALQNFNGGNSASDSLTTMDGLGRTVFLQTRQGPTSANYNTLETDYNNVGLPYRSTMPYTALASPSSFNTTIASTTRTFDALGRVLTIQDTYGGAVSYAYLGNDVLQKISGSQTFQKQLEFDGLGRLTSVCELSTTLSGVGTCAQTTAQAGYWTRYTYDPVGRLLTVTQNAQAVVGSQQTRKFVYDMLGRVTSETTPESGTKTYVYDSDSTMCGNGASTMNGDLVKTTDAAGNCVMYYYDQLHRLTDVGNSNQSVSHCRRFRYDNSAGYAGSAKPSGLTNTLGRLTEAATDYCFGSNDSILTDEWFSYDERGAVKDVYELTPHSGSYYHVTASYWPTGIPQTVSGIPGVPTIYYGASDGSGLDTQGRLTKVTASTGTAPVTSVSYSAGTPTAPLGYLTGVTFGSGDSDTFTYEPNTGHLASYAFSLNGRNDTGTLTWNPNGTLSQLNINDQIPGTVDTQTCNYMHDDLQRVSSTNCGSIWTQTFTYDAFGNITKAGNSAFTPTYSTAQNRFTSIPGVNVSYDANGNLLADNLNNYTWDPSWGTMRTVNSGTTTVTPTYDALGRMVENDAGGAYSEFIYAPTGAKVARTNGQTLLNAVIALPGGAKAIYNTSGLAYYRHSDWLGSSRLTSTASRGMYSSLAYAPFGEQYAISGTADPSFTGQDPNSISSLYDFLYRRDSPSQGRWISRDPYGTGAADPYSPQSWNGYGYVGDNSLNTTDPNGLKTITPGFGSNPGWFISANETFGQFGSLYTVDGVDTPASVALSLIQGGAVSSANLCGVFGCTQIRQDPDTGEWEQIIGWQTKEKLDLNGDVSSAMVPIWGDYYPDMLSAGPMFPGMNGAFQAAKDAAKNFMKRVKPDPPTVPGPPEKPPEFPDDFQDDLTKLIKEALEEAAGQLDVFVTTNPCYDQRHNYGLPECGGGARP